MREPTRSVRPSTNLSQSALIRAAFDTGDAAAERFAQVVPSLDRDRVEHAVASVLLEEAWVNAGGGV